MSYEIESIIVLSTAHITQETAEAFELEHLPFTVWKCEYGFVVSARNFETDQFKPSIPEDLAAVQVLARDNGCRYIMLDRDGPTVEELSTFDW